MAGILGLNVRLLGNTHSVNFAVTPYLKAGINAITMLLPSNTDVGIGTATYSVFFDNCGRYWFETTFSRTSRTTNRPVMGVLYCWRSWGPVCWYFGRHDWDCWRSRFTWLCSWAGGRRCLNKEISHNMSVWMYEAAAFDNMYDTYHMN